MNYRISYTDGAPDDVVPTYAEARTVIDERWPDAEVRHDGDLDGGGDRTLVWATEADSVNDDGARAVASIRRAP